MFEADTYKTINANSEGFYKEKGSKFYAFAYPVKTEDEISKHRQELRKKYYDARHHVYAFRLNPDSNIYRSSDDGEPANSSGPPVLGQIKSDELYEILIVVVRYFGGTKLGIPGLVHAYKTAAADAIQNAEIIEKRITRNLELTFPYEILNEMENLSKNPDIEILNREYLDTCKMTISIARNSFHKVLEKLEKFHKLKIKE